MLGEQELQDYCYQDLNLLYNLEFVLKKAILNFYLEFYELVAHKRIEQKDISERYIHAHLVSMLTTGLLMWSYAFVACFAISSPVPGIVGIVMSTVHLFSPFLYLKNNNYFFNTNVLIGSGIIHQLTFAYFTGGFDSTILIWLGILPMLAGVMAGRKGAAWWAGITTTCIFVYMMMKLNGFKFPFMISETGLLLSQALILFGWVFIASVVIWVHVFLVEQNAAKLEEARDRTQNLVNVLSHDISTPLAVIVVKLNQLLKTPLNELQLNMTAKAIKATERVQQITESVKELRLTELGKKEITYSEVIIQELILELKDIFSDRLENKNLKFHWSTASEIYSFPSSKSLLLHQILGNLLSNAVKFSDRDNEIRLRVSKIDNYVQFVLEDSGMGIPQDMRDHVFEANSSKTSPGTDGELGTGFGLPIVKGCVDRLHGKISFESRTASEGPSGTRFKLLFPISLS